MQIELIGRRNAIDGSFVKAEYDAARGFRISGQADEIASTTQAVNEDDVCIAYTTKAMADGSTRQCFYKIPVHLKSIYEKQGYRFFYLSRKTYDNLTVNTDDKTSAFEPDTQESLSDNWASGFADSGWMILTLCFSTLPMMSGGLLTSMSPWSFLGVSLVAVPFIVGVVYPTLVAFRYKKDFGHWPNKSEWADIAIKTLGAAFKYALIDVGWSFAQLVLPLIFHFTSISAGVFGGGPLGIVAFHLTSAVIAGLGAGVGSYLWHVGTRVYSHFFTTPKFTSKFPYFQLNCHFKPKHERDVFSFTDVFVKPIFTVAIPSIVSGMCWYGASLIPGGVQALSMIKTGASLAGALVLPILKSAAMPMLGYSGAILAAGLGSPVVAATIKGVGSVVSKVGSWIKNLISKSPAPNVNAGPAPVAVDVPVENAVQPEQAPALIVRDVPAAAVEPMQSPVKGMQSPVKGEPKGGSQAVMVRRLDRGRMVRSKSLNDLSLQGASTVTAPITIPRSYAAYASSGRASSLSGSSLFSTNTSMPTSTTQTQQSSRGLRKSSVGN